MTAFSNVSIGDGQTTPVVHTFNPLTLENTSSGSLATLVNRSASTVDIGFEELKLGFRVPNGERGAGASASASRIYKVTMSLKMPVLESTSAATGTGFTPAPTVAYVLGAKIEFMLPARSSLQQRKDMRSLVHNLLGHTQSAALIETLEGHY